MRKPRLHIDDQEFSINTQHFAPKLVRGKYYNDYEVEILKIIIG